MPTGSIWSSTSLTIFSEIDLVKADLKTEGERINKTNKPNQIDCQGPCRLRSPYEHPKPEKKNSRIIRTSTQTESMLRAPSDSTRTTSSPSSTSTSSSPSCAERSLSRRGKSRTARTHPTGIPLKRLPRGSRAESGIKLDILSLSLIRRIEFVPCEPRSSGVGLGYGWLRC